jgi:hypothetical protein
MECCIRELLLRIRSASATSLTYILEMLMNMNMSRKAYLPLRHTRFRMMPWFTLDLLMHHWVKCQRHGKRILNTIAHVVIHKCHSNWTVEEQSAPVLYKMIHTSKGAILVAYVAFLRRPPKCPLTWLAHWTLHQCVDDLNSCVTKNFHVCERIQSL